MYGLPDEVILSVKGLTVELPKNSDRKFAVKNVSFDLMKDEVLCLIGVSGSGKSIIAQSIIKLNPKKFQSTGNIIFRGERIDRMTAKQIQNIRGKNISIIFQDSTSYLNPNLKIREQIKELFEAHDRLDWFGERVKVILKEVDLPEDILEKYPFELSGGMRQRILIAMAIALQPDIIISDESTTAIDSINQQKFIELIKKLKFKYGISFLFITHDMALVSELADRIMVIHNGALAEMGQASKILDHPVSVHTKNLLDAVRTKYNKKSSFKDILLKIENVKKTYHRKVNFSEPIKKEVLRGCSLDIYKGEILGLIGRNGVGKTTIAKIISGVLSFEEGKVYYDGKSISTFTQEELRAYRLGVQNILQNTSASLNPRKKVRDLILQGLVINHFPKSMQKDTLAEVMELLKIPSSYLDLYPHELSLGNKQRISIARALALSPKLLIADEPIASLDTISQSTILGIFDDLRHKKDVSILFISHNMRAIYQLCDRVASIDCGVIKEVARAEDMFRHPKSEISQKLVNSALGKKLFLA